MPRLSNSWYNMTDEQWIVMALCIAGAAVIVYFIERIGSIRK